MSQFATQQPQGFKNHIENIAIVGAGGQVGKFITTALLSNGKHNLTAITRVGSTNKIPTGVTIKPVDYNSHASLVTALQGQDALIITMNVMAPPDTQSKLIAAAADANIPWVLTNEFGSSGYNEAADADTFLGPAKKAVRAQVESLGKSSWVGICCGFWYEFSLGGGDYRYGFDFKKKTALFYDDGTTRLNTSTWPQVGRAVANLLSLKVLKEDENDKGPCLTDYKNKFAHISSFAVNQQEMFESILRVTNKKESDWKITKKPAKDVYDEGKEMFKGGNRMGFGKMLYSRYFFPDKAGLFEEVTGLDNERLRLPKEDLDEFTKVAIGLAESGYFDHEFTPK
ncbi:hypothetical protein G7Y89_g12344 [Cudoniella acicularis]|uniref:NmrA-like domain-containing protein n=1 Tax=Cudoniella acicularis TaxID=354080 RepID=A0A8H4RA99_9HELO|nr:hypothetical protein G7Y89_g12344 [Cudoniella acicularis]